MREIGGPFAIELPAKSGEFYQEYEKRLIRLESGRSCYEYAVLHAKPKALWLPVYNCSSVEQRIQSSLLKKYGLKVNFYNIDETFTPLIPTPTSRDEMVCWVNFWGVTPLKRRQEMAKRFPLLLIDNTQAFYDPPLEGTYTVYSCRKFFGVADGAYLILPEKCTPDEKICIKGNRIGEKNAYLLQALESGQNAIYQDFKSCQSTFAECGIMEMSRTSRYILERTDYEDARRRRRMNFQVLQKALGAHNKIAVALEEGQAPFRYPFVCNNEVLRRELVRRHIYVARWWAETIEDSRANAFEKKMAHDLMPIPLDQRYNEDDMRYVLRVIHSFWKKGE